MWVWGGVAVLLVALSPWASTLADHLWGCTFKEFTGYACPTCGTARAAVALAKLDVVHAFTSYPLPSLAWTAFIGGGFMSLGALLLGRTPIAIPTSLSVPVRVAIVAAIIANWVFSMATGV